MSAERPSRRPSTRRPTQQVHRDRGMAPRLVLPLAPDDPKPVRKQRVAELHDLWLRSGCNNQLMFLLLKERQGGSL